MRISNNLQATTATKDIAALQSEFARAQSELSGGKRIATMSDDPLAGQQVLGIADQQRGITQYKRNITAGRTRLSAEESVLSQVTDLLSRAKELGTSANNAGLSAANRLASGAEVDAILQQVAQLANSSLNGEFIFSGNQTTTKPFTITGSTVTYAGDGASRSIEVAAGQTVSVSQPGSTLFLGNGTAQDPGTFNALISLRDALNTNSQTGVGNALDQLEAAFNVTQTTLATTGARARQLDSAEQVATERDSALTTSRSNFEDADVAQAIIRVTAAQNALQAAYSATSKALSTRLVDYLR